ncbi:MAG: hypothetical protein CMI00_10380 [Oceanospirillaceae bacterium]|nr:hypothetical protein [Oceanospirillaceae bacterium]|tara:strand:- start:25535 stop:26125 length:591 start_codon:yes stop_codon:yes gene_type:complete
MKKKLPTWRLFIRITALGIVTGIAITGLSLKEIGTNRWNQNGDWLYQLSVGDESSSIFQKAVIAAGGLFALSRSESMYFIARPQQMSTHDMKGSCHYRISGESPDTRWWSITVYGHDRMLIPNPEKRYSFSDRTVSFNPDGTFTIDISPTETGENWIPTSGDRRINVLLRVYNPAPSLVQGAGNVALPRVEEVSCS